MQRILARERERVDRSGGCFSLLLFSVGSSQRDRETLTHLVPCCIAACGGRTRPAGSTGAASAWCCSTPSRSAWTLSDDVSPRLSRSHCAAGLPCLMFIPPARRAQRLRR